MMILAYGKRWGLSLMDKILAPVLSLNQGMALPFTDGFPLSTLGI